MFFILKMSLILLLLSCSKTTDDNPSIKEPEQPELVSDEYVLNNQFEEFIDFTGNKGVWKVFGGGKDDTATAVYKENSGYKGSNTIMLRADQKSDIAVSQYLAKELEYRKLYRLSGRIKTESVQGDGGANLTIVGSWVRSDVVVGTSDWTYVSVDFFGPENGELAIGSRLGFWNAEATGIAYFDNIRVTEPEDVFVTKGEKIEAYIADELVYGTDQQMEAWLGRLDNFYTSYVELLSGKIPYEGRTMLIQSNPRNFAWAWAGEYIYWNEDYVTNALKLVVEEGDACFGIVHEIGHNFAPGNWDDYNGSWIWDEEVMANFRMAYALEDLNETVVMNEQKWVGADIINFYKIAYDNTITIGQEANGDAIQYTLLRLVNEYGWEPIINAFDELYAMNKGISIGNNKWEKFEFFLNTISKYTPEDVKNTYTTDELTLIESALNK